MSQPLWFAYKSGVYDAAGVVVCRRHEQEADDARWNTNSRLLSSAPDLLAALEGFAVWLDAAPENYQRHFADRIIAARTAIAKARGGA